MARLFLTTVMVAGLILGVGCANHPTNFSIKPSVMQGGCSGVNVGRQPYPRESVGRKPGTPEHVAAAQGAWAEAISRHIVSCWVRPREMVSGPTVKVRANIDSAGRVLSAEIVEPSTYPPFDDSIVVAIRRASPFPLPEVPEAFEPLLEMTFAPEALERLKGL